MAEELEKASLVQMVLIKIEWGYSNAQGFNSSNSMVSDLKFFSQV
jgi:hypothetical protein